LVDVRAEGLIVLVVATFLRFGTHLARAFVSSLGGLNLIPGI
jgi:hypothetical protein